MNETIKLKPCPFCGGKAERLHSGGDEYFIGCEDCEAHSSSWKDPTELWNTRINESSETLKAENERLDKWRLALEGLTAQGSEFHNDLERCVAYVRERYKEGHEAMKDRVKLTREIERLKEALRWCITYTEGHAEPGYECVQCLILETAKEALGEK